MENETTDEASQDPGMLIDPVAGVSGRKRFSNFQEIVKLCQWILTKPDRAFKTLNAAKEEAEAFLGFPVTTYAVGKAWLDMGRRPEAMLEEETMTVEKRLSLLEGAMARLELLVPPKS